MNSVGKRIKELRSAKGLTQEQIAQLLHVTRQAVSNWENGKTQPDIDTLTQLAAALDVSVEEIIYGSISQKPGILPKRGDDDPLFSHSGRKLKILAKIVFGIGCVFSLILGFAASYIGLLLITPVGCLLSWVVSLPIYGIGKSVENSEQCLDILSSAFPAVLPPEPAAPKEPEPPQRPWICYSCGEENEGRVAYCIHCNTSKAWSLAKEKKE